MATDIERIQKDFEAIIFVLSQTPMCVEGQEHTDARWALWG
jgi:hypothetical protein